MTPLPITLQAAQSISGADWGPDSRVCSYTSWDTGQSTSYAYPKHFTIG